MQPEAPTLTLRDYLVPINRRKWLILALVVVITGVVVVHYARKPISYTASTKVYDGSGTSAGAIVGGSQADQAVVLTSTEVAAVVARKIGYRGSAAALAASVSAAPSATTDFLTITSTQSSALEAIKVVNGFAQEYLARNNQAQIAQNNKQITSYKSQLAQDKGSADSQLRAQIESQIQQLQLANQTDSGTSAQIDPAQSASASQNSTLEYGILAAIGTLIGGILLAFALERLDPRLKSVREAALVYDNPVLATIPDDPNVDRFIGGKPALSERSREAFRDLRVALDLLTDTEDGKTILITSAVAGEGKSTITRNLALAISEAGRRVVVIDADLRKPALPKLLGVQQSSAGLTALLSGTESVEAVTQSVSAVTSASSGGSVLSLNDYPLSSGLTTESELFFISAGKLPPNPLAVLESDAFRSVLEHLRSTYDAVLIDSAPVATVSDAMPLAKLSDAIVLVARSSTDSRSARHASELIARVPGASVAGIVVNAVGGAEASAYGKGYGYYYYGYGRRSGGRAASS